MVSVLSTPDVALFQCKCLCPCNGASSAAADGEGKVNYFELATNLRTLKVR